MEVPHVFEVEERTDSPCSKRWYAKLVTPGCEWVLEGKGEACRMYDGPFVRVEGGKLHFEGKVLFGADAEDAQYYADLSDKLGEAWNWLVDELRIRPKERFAIGTALDGLYQLIEQDTTLGCHDNNERMVIARPRLVRVGEDKPFDYRDTWPNWGAPYTPESLIYLLQGGFHKTGPFRYWHGILWWWEVECPECEGTGIYVISPWEKQECVPCHGTGRITHYAKVERRLLS